MIKNLNRPIILTECRRLIVVLFLVLVFEALIRQIKLTHAQIPKVSFLLRLLRATHGEIWTKQSNEIHFLQLK